jgi:hypothetical protein
MLIGLLTRRDVRPLLLGLAAAMIAAGASFFGGGSWTASADGGTGGTTGGDTTAPAPTVPGAPRNVQAEAGNRKAIVKWMAPESDGGSRTVAYMILSDSGISRRTGGGARHAVVPNLENGKDYTFRVQAVNKVGAGPLSGPSNPVTPLAPQDDPKPGHGPQRIEDKIHKAEAKFEIKQGKIESHEEMAKAKANAHAAISAGKAKARFEQVEARAGAAVAHAQGTPHQADAEQRAEQSKARAEDRLEQGLQKIEMHTQARIDMIEERHSRLLLKLEHRFQELVQKLTDLLNRPRSSDNAQPQT